MTTAETSERARAGRAVHRAVILTGRIGTDTGGPLATMANIVQALEADGTRVRLMALSDASGVLALSGRLPALEAQPSPSAMVRTAIAAVRADTLVVIVGVWHWVFVLGTLLGRLRGATTILVPTNSLTAWDWSKHRTVKRLLSPLVHLCLATLDRIVFASSGELADCRPRSCTRRGVVIPHAVSLDEAPDDSRVGDRGARTVTYVGRVAPQKDIEMLLEAVSLLDDVDLEVYGTGDQGYIDRLTRRAADLGVRCAWRGWADRGRVLEVMATASVLAVTSYSENFCHVAAEAASMGTPVVLVDRVASATDLALSPCIHVCASEPAAVASTLRGILEEEVVKVSKQSAHDFWRRTWSPSAYAESWSRLVDDSRHAGAGLTKSRADLS